MSALACGGAALLVSSLALALLAPAVATAAPPSADASSEAGLEAFLAGSRLLKEGRAAEALVELERSMAQQPSPNTELLVGHALRQLGRRTEAAAAYERVTAAAAARVRDGEERFRPTLADAGRWGALLRAELAVLTIALSSSAASMEVTIDGAMVALTDDGDGRASARVWREPGVARIVARDAGGTTREATVDLARGGDERVTLDLGGSPDEEGIPPPPPAAWIAGGVGAVGLVSFAVFGAMAESAASDLRACEPGCDPGDPANRDAVDSGQRDATIANVSLAVGVAGIATGAILWALWPEDEPSRDSAITVRSIAVRPGGIGASGSFR